MVEARGGKSAAEYDIFLDVSTDGFDVFGSGTYDCWPVIAMVHNLHPSERFLMRNVVPLGFIKGPREPVRLDTFLLPLVQKLKSINGGHWINLLFADGVERRVKVHLLWFKGDGPASQKIGGLVGAKGKHMCRFCSITGHFNAQRKSYYFSSRVKVAGVDGSKKIRWKRC